MSLEPKSLVTSKTTTEAQFQNGIGSIWDNLNDLLVGGVLPTQTGQAGKFLTTDGTSASWSGNVAVNFSVNTNKFTVDATSGNAAVAGDLDVTGDFKVNTNKLVVTAATGALASGAITSTGLVTATGVAINQAAGNVRSYSYMSGGVLRWAWRANSVTETGSSNTGSNIELASFDDSGTQIDLPISIVRALAGAITMPRPVSVDALTLTGTTAPSATGMALTNTNNLTFYHNGTNKGRVSSTGFVMGTYTSGSSTITGSTNPHLQVLGNTDAGSSMMLQNYANGTNGPIIGLTKTRGALATAVQSGDTVGSIIWSGGDGTNRIAAASIVAVISATPGTNDMPTDLVFSTTADGASTVTERMRIAQNGAVSMTGTLSVAGNSLAIGGNANTGATVSVNSAAATQPGYVYRTAGVAKWYSFADGAESGSNAGANFKLTAYSDAGAAIDDVITAIRASGGAISLGTGTSRPVNAYALTINGALDQQSFLRVRGNSGITSITSGYMGISVEGGTADTHWQGIDFRTNGNGTPMGRFAMQRTSAGSVFGWGLSNNYGTGITTYAMSLDYNGVLTASKVVTGVADRQAFAHTRSGGAGNTVSFGAEIDGRLTIANSAAYDLILNINGTAVMTIAAATNSVTAPGIYSVTGSSSAVNVNPSGTLSRVSSSLRYKRDVKDYLRDPNDLLKLKAKTFKYNSVDKEGNFLDDRSYPGFIAEETHDLGLHEFVIYDDEGRPDGFKYDFVSALIVEYLRLKDSEFVELKGEVAALKDMVIAQH